MSTVVRRSSLLIVSALLVVAACESREVAAREDSLTSQMVASSSDEPALGDVAHLFPSIEELEADDELNPSHARLANAQRTQVQELYQEAGAALRLIAKDRAAAQQRVARERIERGEGTEYVPGATPLEVSGAGAVVLASKQGQPTMMVRVTPDELPETEAWSEMERAIGEELRGKLREVFRTNASAPEQQAH